MQMIMVVVAPTVTSGRCKVDHNTVLKKVKEFRSLENDLSFVSNETSDVSCGMCSKISKFTLKNDVSVSLPNLSSAIILLDNHSTVDVDEGEFNGDSSCNDDVKKWDSNNSWKGKSWSNSMDNSVHLITVENEKSLDTNCEELEINDTRRNTIIGNEVCTCTTEKSTGTRKNSTSQELSPSFKDLSCCGTSKLLEITGDQDVQHQSYEELDLEQADELTRLKESPRSSPGNTLDSMTSSSSLGRTDSFGKTDASSYSSVSSLSTDAPTANPTVVDCEKENANNEDSSSVFVEVSLKNQNTFEKSTVSQDSGIDTSTQLAQNVQQTGTKPKRKGITLGGFLTRNLFSRKPKEEASSAPGWKLFGKIPPKEVAQRQPAEISQEYQARKDSITSSSMPTTVLLPGDKAKKCDIEVLSTTALILEQRPMGLPSKDPEEELKHRQMYEQMVEAAKKKEQKDSKQRKKQLEQQLKYEDYMSAALRVWNTEILPNWQTMQFCKKSLDLWWRGIPPSVRGKVWKLAFGNDLNLTKDLYHICVNRAKERLKLIEDWCGDTDSVCSHMSGFSEHSASREASVELIKLDVSRTFPQLCIFQKGGPYHEVLQGLLGAYACYRPDVGYVQGMSFIAAVLLLNMDVQDAFICFANLLNRPCQIAFFRLDESLMKSYFDTYEEFFEENQPKLYDHFRKLNVTPDLYIIDWMFTLYAKSLPLDVASRVWDVFSRDGEEFLFRTALGILKLYEDVMINMDFIHLAQFLTKLPENIQGDELFKCIEKIKMFIDTRRFKEVLAGNREPQ